jgi:hypothetical protein
MIDNNEKNKNFKEFFYEALGNHTLLLVGSLVVLPIWLGMGLSYFVIPEEWYLFMFVIAFCLPAIIMIPSATIIALVKMSTIKTSREGETAKINCKRYKITVYDIPKGVDPVRYAKVYGEIKETREAKSIIEKTNKKVSYVDLEGKTRIAKGDFVSVSGGYWIRENDSE